MRIARQNISNSIYPRLADTATFSEKSNLSCKEASNNWQWKFQILFQINRWYLHNGRPASWCEARSCVGCDLPLVDCCQRAVLRLFYFQKCILGLLSRRPPDTHEETRSDWLQAIQSSAHHIMHYVSLNLINSKDAGTRRMMNRNTEFCDFCYNLSIKQ